MFSRCCEVAKMILASGGSVECSNSTTFHTQSDVSTICSIKSYSRVSSIPRPLDRGEVFACCGDRRGLEVRVCDHSPICLIEYSSPRPSIGVQLFASCAPRRQLQLHRSNFLISPGCELYNELSE
ncbi:unnamed protein product, partial [Sphacelaria rigidula]